MEVLSIGDSHLDHRKPQTRSYRAAKAFAADMRPTVIVVHGDFLDFEYLGKWNRDLPLLNEDARYAKDCEYARRELAEWRSCCKTMFFLPGNHEERVNIFVQRTPILAGMIGVRKDFGIDELGIGWKEFNEVLKVGKLNFTHGWYYNKYHARKHLDEMGDHLFYGHVHDHQVAVKPVRATREPYMAMSMGCLCELNPAWKKNRPNEWIAGVGYFEIATSGSFTPLFIPIIGGELTFGRHTWKEAA